MLWKTEGDLNECEGHTVQLPVGGGISSRLKVDFKKSTSSDICALNRFESKSETYFIVLKCNDRK